MTDDQSTSSAALERMKAAADAGSAPGAPSQTAPSTEPAERSETPPSPTADSPREPGQAAATARRMSHVRREKPASAPSRINDWLDSLGEPDWDEVTDAIYESPTRTKQALQRARQRRQDNRRRRAEEKERLAAEQAREAEERADREARERAQAEAERREAERVAAERAHEEEVRLAAEAVLERQRAEEQALREELEREEAEAALRRQQERETRALQQAAQEEDGSAHVPPASRRPMLQQPGEHLTDAQLLERARESLPEWRRLDRIVEKAQAIEAATQRHRPALDVADVPSVEEPPRAYIPPYNLPSTDPDPEPNRTDLARRIVVTLTWAAFVFAGLWSLGMVGERPMLHQLAEGRYSSDVSMLSMASWHLAIWPILWLALGVHVVHQWMPSQTSAERQRATGWRLSAAMAGVTLWLVLTRLGLAWFDVFVWLAIGYLLVDTVHQLNLYTARTRAERVITDGMIGLFTGWSIIFTATVISIWLQRAGVDVLWIPGSLWAVATLVVVIWGTAMLTMTERGRMTIALGLAWGLAAILGPRLISPMQSVWVAIVAAMGAFIVLLATENRRYRINHAEHRAALGHEPEDF